MKEINAPKNSATEEATSQITFSKLFGISLISSLVT
jgi:hypothetical protein